MEKRFTDMHIHLIPGVDDGAEDMDCAINMIKLAADEGIGSIIATPHSAAFDGIFPGVHSAYRKLKELARQEVPDVSIMLGCEVFFDRENLDVAIKRIRKKKYPTLNDSGYVLIEFAAGETDPDMAHDCISAVLELGLIPILAHAERCGFEVERLYEFRESGCMLQANYSDLIPRPDYPMTIKADRMLRDEKIDFLATDAHNMTRRRPVISEYIGLLRSVCSGSYFERLMYENPALLKNMGDRV